MSRMLSIAVLIGILVVIGVLFFRVMSIFIIPAFLAALLGVMFQPLYHRMLDRVGKEKNYLAAGLSVATILVIVLAPAGLVLFRAAVDGVALVDALRDVNVRDRLSKLRSELDLDIRNEDDLQRIGSVIARCMEDFKAGRRPSVDRVTLANIVERAKILKEGYDVEMRRVTPGVPIDELVAAVESLRDAEPGTVAFDNALAEADRAFKRFRLAYLGGPYRAWLRELANPDDEQIEQLRNGLINSSRPPLLAIGASGLSLAGKTVFGLVVMLTTLFFIFADGPWILDELLRVSPLEERYVRELLREFDSASRAVVLATLLAALAQGTLAGIGFWMFGVEGGFLLTALTTLLALVPFLGAASVWVPVSLWLYFYNGETGRAIGMALYGLLVISSVDNLIKPMVLHGQSKLHPLLAFMSVLGGVQALGPIGILIGPMAVVFLQTLAKILHREYKAFEARTSAADDGDDDEDDPGDSAEVESSVEGREQPSEPKSATEVNGKPKEENSATAKVEREAESSE